MKTKYLNEEQVKTFYEKWGELYKEETSYTLEEKSWVIPLGLFEEEEIVAIIGYTYNTNGYIEVTNNFTIPEQRKKGYNKILVDSILDIAKIMDVDIRASCVPTSVELFKKKGFVENDEHQKLTNVIFKKENFNPPQS